MHTDEKFICFCFFFHCWSNPPFYFVMVDNEFVVIKFPVKFISSQIETFCDSKEEFEWRSGFGTIIDLKLNQFHVCVSSYLFAN